MIIEIVLCLLALALNCVAHHYADGREARLMAEMAELRKENQLLTEALLRKHGEPISLTKREAVPSEGWFDGKPHITKISQS